MKTHKDNLITDAQRRLYWRAFAAACQNLGLTGEEREEYRRRVMVEEAGVEHVGLLNRTHDFDEVMARFWRDAGDWQMAAKFASGEAFRYARIVRICLTQIMQLKGVAEGTTEAGLYLAAICRQAKINCRFDERNPKSFWLDVPASKLLIVFQILDTYRRRLCERFMGEGFESMRGFCPDFVYQPKAAGGLIYSIDPRHYDKRDFVRVRYA